MIINANLTYSGFFQLVLTSLLKITRSPFGLLSLLTFGSGILFQTTVFSFRGRNKSVGADISP